MGWEQSLSFALTPGVQGASPAMEGCEPKPARDHYPMCIVWTPIPILTYLLPFVGHLGVATTDGMIYDFIGPFTIHTSPKRTGFGCPTKYYFVHAQDVQRLGGCSVFECWDTAVEQSSAEYETHVHNLLCDNCHHHVALALNNMQFRGKSNWDTTSLILFMLQHSKYVSTLRMVQTYAGFVGVLLLFCFIYLYSRS